MAQQPLSPASVRIHRVVGDEALASLRSSQNGLTAMPGATKKKSATQNRKALKDAARLLPEAETLRREELPPLANQARRGN
jgi:hypothetical protein